MKKTNFKSKLAGFLAISSIFSSMSILSANAAEIEEEIPDVYILEIQKKDIELDFEKSLNGFKEQFYAAYEDAKTVKYLGGDGNKIAKLSSVKILQNNKEFMALLSENIEIQGVKLINLAEFLTKI